MPAGLLDAARCDLEVVYCAIERDLNANLFLAGEALSIAEIALFPHLSSTRSSATTPSAIRAWLKRLRAIDSFAADLDRVKAFLAGRHGSCQGVGNRTLRLVPIAQTMPRMRLRAAERRSRRDPCGAKPGRALGAAPQWHTPLLEYPDFTPEDHEVDFKGRAHCTGTSTGFAELR